MKKIDAFEPSASGLDNFDSPSKNDILFEFDQSPEDAKSIISAAPNLHTAGSKVSLNKRSGKIMIVTTQVFEEGTD